MIYIIATIFALACVRAGATTLDDQYRRLEGRPEREIALGVTKLLAQAYAPLIQILHDEVVADPGRVARLAPPLGDAVEKEAYAHPTLKKLGLDGRLRFDVKNRVSFKDYNVHVVRRWARAVRAFRDLALERRDALEAHPTWQGAQVLLIENSWSENRFKGTIEFASVSAIDSVGQLTAQSAGDFTADQMLDRVTSVRARRASLNVVYALRLIPQVLARSGAHAYVTDGVALSASGWLEFSAKMERSFAVMHHAFARLPHASYELGFGCPLAHAVPGQPINSLQLYLNAVRLIYDQLPVEDCGNLLGEPKTPPTRP